MLKRGALTKAQLHIEVTLLQKQVRKLRTQLVERDRSCNDLVDGTLQSLYAVGLELESYKRLASTGRRRTRATDMKLNRAIAHLQDVVDMLRISIKRTQRASTR